MALFDDISPPSIEELANRLANRERKIHDGENCVRLLLQAIAILQKEPGSPEANDEARQATGYGIAWLEGK